MPLNHEHIAVLATSGVPVMSYSKYPSFNTTAFCLQQQYFS